MSTLTVTKVLSVPTPTRGSQFSAGLDIFNPKSVVLYPFQQTLIKTGLKITLPEGTYGRIAPRSSLSLKYNLWINAGVIDSDYRGELGVIIMNMNSRPFTLEQNVKFCQLICEKVEIPKLLIREETDVEIQEVPQIQKTRGENGFGSTGEK